MRYILIVTQMEAGGAQGAAVRLHTRMKEQGYDSELVFLYRKRGVYDDVSGVRVLFEKKPEGALECLVLLKRLYLLFREQKHTRILCFTHYANIIGAFIGKLACVDRINISHRSLQDCYSRLVRWVDKIMGTLGFYDRIICVSKSVACEFKNYPRTYREKIETINNGVDTPNIIDSSKYDWVADKNYLNLVTAGRLHEQKNHSVLFDAVKKNSKIRLIIAGDGHLKKDYENYIYSNGLQSRIILLGEIPPIEVMNFISRGDIFVFPSKTEAFGFSLVEAMSLGMPVVTSNINSLADIGQGELIQISPLDEFEWSEVFFKDFKEPDLIRMADVSKRIASYYSFDKMYNSYLRVLTND